MLMFLSGLVLLIAGYFTYGRLVEKIIGPDDRKTPAVEVNDGVDYLVLPKWKNMLIQLLNIAGVGPVIGVILGLSPSYRRSENTRAAGVPLSPRRDEPGRRDAFAVRGLPDPAQREIPGPVLVRRHRDPGTCDHRPGDVRQGGAVL